MRHKVVFQDDNGHLLLEYYFLQPTFCHAQYQICVSLFGYTLSDISRMYLYSKTTGIVLIILKNMFISILYQVFFVFIPAIKQARNISDYNSYSIKTVAKLGFLSRKDFSIK
ncbi:hypothetical protein PHYBLDRAFT_174680 [Phycomyces blakesleeanus NRRL 1555(-)]|uniref:Uncharacterized protein n=1 Tax=Phycomyces blakesleeanus (strain ATCC 8743b / DSM 1359 / FGSC 10004 / NBRC 33097 / NRRL 1555) TaxID=763407 RepID=A0A162T950_PHYB8|nr:hypothetical protein PHYBLDRAFT_174680 [Phycomyces blakesleeanus NRRL 1555(-)]OAD66972.1 hypothetical protein PHYBLDRAFT_174680 [Phycomyces blakesleeanus NRRL 1555(-)]|eukprot:XP_018285012.1 hypothetical protein PHYBLDRAFT_174680 [Phycomyces blakesleeanus NRRL 1555(-)]